MQKTQSGTWPARPIPNGQQAFTTVGTTSFVVPADVTSISAVCVGGGQAGGSNSGSQGGRGGDLRYITALAVTPGETLTVTVGAGGTVPAGGGGGSKILRGASVLLEAGCVGFSSSSTISGNIGGGSGGVYGAGSLAGAGGGGVVRKDLDSIEDFASAFNAVSFDGE